MDFFVKKCEKEQIQNNVFSSQISFKAIKPSKEMVEISDDIFKIASAAITAAGVAALGIKAKQDALQQEQEESKKPNLITRGKLAKEILKVNQHSVDWHVKVGHIILTQDNMVDLNNETNKRFIENFKKGKRVKQEVLGYRPEMYDKLQARLGKNLPIEYCLKHGLLIADEKGEISINNEQNKEFLQKIDSGEINYRSFFMSKEEFAAYLEIGKISITRAAENGGIEIDKTTHRIDINNPKNLEFKKFVELAKQDAKERGLIRPVSFSKPKEKNRNPNKYTLKEFAKKLGYSQPSCLHYHIINGRIVVENGLIDISVEPNKSFYSAKLSGKLPIRPALVTRQKKLEKSEEAENPNIKSKTYVAKELLGISLPSLMYHIKQGHLILNEDGKIDITNETNKFLLENHKKGLVLFPNTGVNPLVKPKEEKQEIKNPNYINITDLSFITGLTLWPILQHVEKGRIVREQEGVDVTNQTNRYFINRYEERGIEKLDKMSLREIANLKYKIKNRYENLLPRIVYIQAKEAKNKSEEVFDAYIKNTVYTLFRVEILSSRELKFIENIVKNIIETRIDDAQKPSDFSDIKEFMLTGVIEVEHELNIIDKLIDVYGDIELSDKKLAAFLNDNRTKNFELRNLDKFNISNVIKPNIKDFTAIIEWIRRKKQADVETLSINELKLKLLELSETSRVKDNHELSMLIEFLYEYEFIEETEIDMLRSFIKELISYSELSDREFSKDILENTKAIEQIYSKSEQKKKEKFERIVSGLEDSQKLFYTKGLGNAADICYKYIPQDCNDTETITNANYIIQMANLINEELEMPDGFEDDKLISDKEAEIEKLKSIRIKEVEDTIVGFDIQKSDSTLYNELVSYIQKNNDEVTNQNVGKYARHLSNLDNNRFSSYPDFGKELYAKLNGLEKHEALSILLRLEQWTNSYEYQKKMFLTMYNLFSKTNSLERKFLESYISKEYRYYDTTILAIGAKDKSLQIPAVFAQRAKDMLCKEVAEREWVEYYEEFESAMQKIVGNDGTCGIKDYEGSKKKNCREHEVKVTYDARLYSHKGNFYVFDEFKYTH